MKLLKRKLLFALACDREFGYHPYKYLYFRTSEFDAGSVRDAVNELVAEGLVDNLRRNRRSLFRLTSVGQDKTLPRRSLGGGGWDGRWRIVIVNKIGNDLRSLQRDLQRLNYRRLSRGVYLSPYPVGEQTREILSDKHWLKQAVLLESRRLLGSDDQQLARNLWHLENLDNQYRQFITLADRLLKLSRHNLVLLQQAKFGFKAVFDAYFRLLQADPGLPKALLPPDWPAERARELFYRLADLANTAKL